MAIELVRDTFYIETVHGYNQVKFPHKFFDPTYRKKRIKTLLEHIVYEIDKSSPKLLLNSVTWQWVVDRRLEKLIPFLTEPTKESKNEISRMILRLAFPDLPETDFNKKTLEVFEEVLSGEKKNFPNNYFAFGSGEDRLKIIYKHIYENILKWNPYKQSYINLDTLQKYRLHKAISNPEEFHYTVYR